MGWLRKSRLVHNAEEARIPLTLTLAHPCSWSRRRRQEVFPHHFSASTSITVTPGGPLSVATASKANKARPISITSPSTRDKVLLNLVAAHIFASSSVTQFKERRRRHTVPHPHQHDRPVRHHAWTGWSIAHPPFTIYTARTVAITFGPMHDCDATQHRMRLRV